MACMCGDLCCPSCGPAQGNARCEECGAWASDGGCPDPTACETKAAAKAAFLAEPVTCGKCGVTGTRGTFSDFGSMCLNCEQKEIDAYMASL